MGMKRRGFIGAIVGGLGLLRLAGGVVSAAPPAVRKFAPGTVIDVPASCTIKLEANREQLRAEVQAILAKFESDLKAAVRKNLKITTKTNPDHPAS
jgi:hypothetical protein